MKFKKIIKKIVRFRLSLIKNIEIVKCNSPFLWYSKSIGMRVKVISEDKRYFITECKIPGNKINRGYILKNDIIRI